jgi:hypothetical protein
MRMKPRHAATLALVGWYLMIPPPGTYVRGRPSWDDGAPLSKWSFYNELSTWTPMDLVHALDFKSKEECETKRNQKWPANPPSLAHAGGDIRERLENYRVMGAKTLCVSADDSRLIGN